MSEVRLNKFLSDAGICSRREADRAVEAGEVTVNGEPAVMGQKIAETDEVCFRGRPVRRKAAESCSRPIWGWLSGHPSKEVWLWNSGFVLSSGSFPENRGEEEPG